MTSVNYLTGWFLVDLASTFPFDTVASATQPGANQGATQTYALCAACVLRVCCMYAIWCMLLIMRSPKVCGDAVCV